MRNELTKEQIEQIRENPKEYGLWSLTSYKSYKLSEDFIREFADYVDWYLILRHQNLSESFIIEFSHKLDFNAGWYNISRYQKLSNEFIINNLDNLKLNSLIENENIPEETKTYIRMFI